MREIINLISEVENYTPNFDKKWDTYDGYCIQTNLQSILVLIQNGQNCCESWGYFSSNDTLSDFIGATLLEVRLTDANLKSQELINKNNWLSVDDCMFVTFVTDKGDFQLAVYNAHNGYYSHRILIKSNQVNEEMCL